jgi:inner membrane protein
MPKFPPPLPSIDPITRRNAVVLKIVLIAVLVLLLQGPLQMVRSMLRERQERRLAAVADISRAWGQAQVIVGPMLVVPFTRTESVTRDTIVDGRKVRTVEQQEIEDYATFLPERLEISSELEPIRRYRGIYVATLYGARLKINGKFAPPDWESLGVRPAAVHWSRAHVAIALRDLRGIREAQLTWAGEKPLLKPGPAIENAGGSGLHADVALAANGGQPLAFEFGLVLNGSEQISFAPVGWETRAQVSSAWADPSFIGAFLPSRSDITAKNFSAEWQVTHFGRGYPQQWTRNSGNRPDWAQLEGSSFGVALVTPVDAYRTVERSLKHGVLFLTLVFMAFFIFEVIARLHLHPLHYTLVGAALCLFYLALLALSEFMQFSGAYLCAASASTLLVSLYSASILRGRLRALLIAALLCLVYGFLYFVLQMQDYALLAGTAALFAMLAAVMFVTRKLTAAGEEPAEAALP